MKNTTTANATAATPAPTTNHLPAPGSRPGDHPLAALFPLMDAAGIAELAQDIKTNGLHDPILLHEGKILDGRNRFAACQQAKVKPSWEFFDARRHGQSPLAYVVSTNLKRRHLTASQKAMIAAEALPLFEAEAKGRQKAAGKAAAGNLKNQPELPVAPAKAPAAALREHDLRDQGVSKKPGMKLEPLEPTKAGKIPGTTVSSFQTPLKPAAAPAAKPVRSRDAAGAAVGVSGSMVGKAKELAAKAPDKAAEVKAGKKTLAAASAEASAESPEIKAALARIEKVAGRGLALAAREGTRLKSPKEILAYAALSDTEMLRTKGLVESGWSVKDALKYKLQAIERQARVGDLLDRAAAAGGRFELLLEGWQIEVTKGPVTVDANAAKK